MTSTKGPALLLAQFAGEAAPFNSWPAVIRRAADCGHAGVQVPSRDGRQFDLEKAAASKAYCDGVSFEIFLDRVTNHSRANMLYDPSRYVPQQRDYLDHVDICHGRIRMFHVNDAELNQTGRQGVYGGYQSWVNRAGRFRKPGDGQVDFGGIFSKLTRYGYAGWAVVEWESCLKHPEDGAREAAAVVRAHILRVTEKAFDDFAGSGADRAANRRMPGLE